MAKSNGLGVRLYSHGWDLSGDVNVLDAIGYTQELLLTTTLDKAANARIAGSSDGSLTVNGWFEQEGQHAAYLDSFKMPTTDQIVLVQMGTALGDPFSGMTAKEATYNVNRASGSAIATTATFSSTAGEEVEWGVMLTASKITSSSAGNGETVDNAASSSAGLVAYLEAVSLASGTVVVKVQHSADASTWVDLITFTSVAAAAAPTAERATATGTINRYLRWNTSGTFSNLVFVVGASRQ